MSTSFELPYIVFFKKIEQDPDFFNYFNLSSDEALGLAKERACGYLKDSISKLTLSCTPDVSFYDFDDTLAEFNFDLTSSEITLLGSLMFEFYLERDIAKLRVYRENLTAQDLKQIHSPANERKTFVDMFTKVQTDNDKKIRAYASRNRLTGARKKIIHSLYQESDV